jgi:hypothetical protein
MTVRPAQEKGANMETVDEYVNYGSTDDAFNRQESQNGLHGNSWNLENVCSGDVDPRGLNEQPSKQAG